MLVPRIGPGAAALVVAGGLIAVRGDAAELEGNLAGIRSEHLQRLRQILEAAGVARGTITSTERSPRAQVEIMYQMVVTEGVGPAKALYCTPGDAVIDRFDARKDKDTNIDAMVKELELRIPEALELGCLNHVSNSQVTAVDVAASSVPNEKHATLIAEAKKAVQTRTLVRFFHPPKDPKAFHFEFRK